MARATWQRLLGLGLLVGGMVVLMGWYHQREAGRLHRVLACDEGHIGMTETQVRALRDVLADRGEGSVGETGEVLVWLAASGKVAGAQVEPSAKAALGLVHLKGVGAREAVEEVLGGGKEMFTRCPP